MQKYSIFPDQEYKVVVCCWTYNQDKYIDDTLNGIIRQNVNFSYCVLVVDDFSTDNNRKIIEKYAQKYPDIIKPIYLDYNHYSKNESTWKYVLPWIEKSKYVAFCEGDDYWIDVDKLQRQADFLDSNLEYTCCVHNSLVKFQNRNRKDYLLNSFSTGDLTTADIIRNWQIQLATYFLRKEVFYSDEFNKLQKISFGSYIDLLAASQTGKVYATSDVMSVYRKNDGGVTNVMQYHEDEMFERHYRMVYSLNDLDAHKAQEEEGYHWLYNGGLLRAIKGDEMSNKILNVIRHYNPQQVKRAYMKLPLVLIKKVISIIGKKSFYVLFLFLALLFGYILGIYVNNNVDTWQNTISHMQFESIESSNPEEFSNSVRMGAYKLIEEESWGSKLSLRDLLLPQKKTQYDVYDYGEYGYLLYYALLYSKSKNDSELFAMVKEKFDKYYGIGTNKEIATWNQIPYGLVAIELLRSTKDSYYKIFADKMYAKLLNTYNKEGNIHYVMNTTEQRIDGLGMICPFLYEYSNEFLESKADTIADNIILDYQKWAIDDMTGYPYKAYDTKTHKKMYSYTWGRGVSWYLLSIEKSHNPEIYRNINKLLSTLKSNSKQLYGRDLEDYSNGGGVPDMSATIPIIWYLFLKGEKSVNEDFFYNQLSPYFDNDGIVRYGSGTYFSYTEIPNVSYTNLMVMGITLDLLRQINTKK